MPNSRGGMYPPFSSSMTPRLFAPTLIVAVRDRMYPRLSFPRLKYAQPSSILAGIFHWAEPLFRIIRVTGFLSIFALRKGNAGVQNARRMNIMADMMR